MLNVYPGFDEREPKCPFCGAESDNGYYITRGYKPEFIGCDNCIKIVSYYDCPEFYPQEDER